MQTLPLRLFETEFSVCGGDKRLNWWQSYASGRWEPQTLALLYKILRPGDLYIDVGAWIGPTVLFAAARGATVVAFEPDRTAFRELAANVAANPSLSKRITLHNTALLDRRGHAG
ncbi:hypothetical protein CCP1ISM_7140001 [Azospirillaceae bacterium]